MKVFMSWSGQRSKLTAELLEVWIKCVIQAAQPWISSKGIERGALWFTEINDQLKDTAVGVICLTQENKAAPWILFETGALAKGLSSSRVCTFLVDIEPADLDPPLAQFNHTFPTKDGMRSLVTTLNNGVEANRLDPIILDRIFETYWPQFEQGFAAIIKNNPETTIVPPREEKEILSEILSTMRGMSKRVHDLEARQIFSRKENPYAGPLISQHVVGESANHYSLSDVRYLNYARQYINAGVAKEDVVRKLCRRFDMPASVAMEMFEKANAGRDPLDDNLQEG